MTNNFHNIAPSGLSATQIKERAGKRDILPTSVKGRFISNVVFGSESGSAQTTRGNGEQAVITSTLTQNNKFEILGVHYIEIYIGSVATANQLPGGSSIDESQWQVIGPFYAKRNWDNAVNPKHEEISVTYIRNISAGNQTVIFRNKWRYFSPREGT